MANFNNQFATQKLREEATEPETWPDRVPGNNGIIWKKEKEGSRGANYVPYYKGHNIDTGGYTFGSVDKLKSFINDYILSNQLYNKLKFEPEKPLDEESVTGTGAGMTPSTVNNPVTQDWYTTKNKKKVKKEGKNIPSDWTDAKSIPNRPTKGGFIYKQLFEELSKFVKEYQDQTNYKITISPTDAQEVAEIIKGEFRNMGVELIDSQTIIINDWDTAYDMLNTLDQHGIMITGHDIPFDPEDEEDDYDYNEINEDNNANTNTEELVRINNLKKDARETGEHSVITKYENAISLLELLVYLEKKLDRKLSVFRLGQNFGEYIRKELGYTGPIKVNRTGGVINRRDIADAIIGLNKKGLSELDINDPILMAMRAKKDAPKPQASKPTKAAIPPAVKNAAKIKALLAQRAAEFEKMNNDPSVEDEGGPVADDYGDILNKIDQKIAALKKQGGWGPETDPYMSQGEIEKRARMIREGYAQFKNETKTRSKPEQFHQAIREVKKKVQQINKMYEYVSRLKTELSEGEDGLNYKIHTEKALNKIKEMVSELNYKIKRFK